MWLTWLFTVASLTTRRSAISALDRPAAMSVRTSASRGVSAGPGGGGTRGRPAPRGSRARLAVGHPVQGLLDLGRARVLGQVAERAGSQRVQDRTVVGVGGQHDYLDRRVTLP